MNIPVIIPYTDHREIEEISKVVNSGWVAQGIKVAEFEKALAMHEGVAEGVATSSCTTALHLLLHGLGIGKGHDVLVPSFTFVASANSIAHTGANPRFIDILPDTFCIDSQAVERYITEHYIYKDNSLIHNKDNTELVAIMVVHQFGLCADMPKITDIATKYNLKIIEDSACALGAKINNTHQGAFGNPSCVSFHPRKSITTGEGGMIFTNDIGFAVRLRGLRSHGAVVSEIDRHNSNGFLLPSFNTIGYNYRMTDIQGAMGLAQLEKLDYILETRRKKAARYNKLLADIDWLTKPIEPKGYYHTYQSYVCMLNLEKQNAAYENASNDFTVRDKFSVFLNERGIATRQGTHACHILKCYQDLYNIEPDSLPNALASDKLSITLPLYVQMTDEQQNFVVDSLKEAYKCLI